MRGVLLPGTLKGVLNAEPVSLAVATAPLISKFGDRLTLMRDGNRAQWSCDGQAAIVELLVDGSLRPTFVDRPSLDAVSGDEASAVYHLASGVSYRMTADGCARMVSDMTDFFSGARDGRFVFAGIATL